MKKRLSGVLVLALLLIVACSFTALADTDDGNIARQFYSDSPTDGLYCSVSAFTLRHYDNIEDDPFFANGGFMMGNTTGKVKAYVICVDFEDCVGAERVEYGDLQNVFTTEGMEYDYSKPETYYNTVFAGSAGFGADFTGTTEYVGLVEYFNQISYGMMDIEVVFVNALAENADGSWPWFRLPKEQREYAIQYASEVEDYRTFARLHQAAVDVAYEYVPDLDMDDVGFLYVIPPVNTFGFRSALQGGAGIHTAFSYQDQALILRDTEYRHEPGVTTKNGVVIGSSTTITKGAREYSGADRGMFRVMAHETGHGLGLIDDYTYSGTDHYSSGWGTPVGNWGIMAGMTANTPDWPAWYKFKSGWIADEEIVTVMPGESKTIRISALGSKDGEYAGTKMVLIPTEWRCIDTFNNPLWNPNGVNYNFLDWFTPVWVGGEENAVKSFPTGYVLESRRDVGADYLNSTGNAGTQGVLITQLSNLTWETGHGAAGLKVMRNPATANNTNTSCIGAGDYAGVNGIASWQDTVRGVKVEVLESTEYYDEVLITYTGEGVDGQGEPVERKYHGELTLSDTYAVAGEQITMEFDLFTIGQEATNGNRTNASVIQAGSPLGVPGGISGFDMVVSYDPAALEFVSLAGPFDNYHHGLNAESGLLDIGASGSSMIDDGIVEVTFKVKDSATPGNYPVTADVFGVKVLTFKGEPGVFSGWDISVAGGNVKVNAAASYVVSGKITESIVKTVGVPAEVALYDGGDQLVAETKSLYDGTYRFVDVPVASGYYVLANKHSYDEARSAAFAVAADVADVDLELQKTYITVSGTIYGDTTDNPLAGAKVQLKDGGFVNVGTEVTTDAEGRYTIPDVPIMVNDYYTLTATADGYGNSYGPNYGVGKGDLFSAITDVTGRDLVLTSSYLISGTISPTNGVYTLQLKQNGQNVGEPVLSNASGVYEISGVQTGQGYTIEVSRSGYITRSTTSFNVATSNVLRKNLTLFEGSNVLVLTAQNTEFQGLAASYPFVGSAVTPAFTLLYEGVALVAGTDYELSYTDNNAVGTATITVRGIGAYSGEVSTTFAIAAAEAKAALNAPTVIYIDGDRYLEYTFTVAEIVRGSSFTFELKVDQSLLELAWDQAPIVYQNQCQVTLCDYDEDTGVLLLKVQMNGQGLNVTTAEEVPVVGVLFKLKDWVGDAQVGTELQGKLVSTPEIWQFDDNSVTYLANTTVLREKANTKISKSILQFDLNGNGRFDQGDIDMIIDRYYLYTDNDPEWDGAYFFDLDDSKRVDAGDLLLFYAMLRNQG